MVNSKVTSAAATLAIIVFSVVILVYAKPFLVPVAIGGLLSMLLLPMVKWLQSKHINNVIAIIISILVFVGVIAGVIALIAWQAQDLAKQATGIEQQLSEKLDQVQRFIAEKLGIPAQKQQEMLKKQQSSAGGKISSSVSAIVAGIGGVLTDTLLVLVYIFLFIYFRHRIKNFIIKVAGTRQKANAEDALSKIKKVSQKYLTGLAMMIGMLWVMYGIGFAIIGVKQPLFFAVLCGILEIVPFVGNLTGTALTVLMSLAQGGDMNLIIGIVLTYALVQFIQTYLLEPLVVGEGVNINPLFTIAGLVAGELIWGISGMILAIPLMAIGKIVCEHVPALRPLAYLVATDKKR